MKKKKGFRHKHWHRPEQRTAVHETVLPLSMNIVISCACVQGAKETNQDYYGLRCGSETETLETGGSFLEKRMNHISHITAAVADGVSLSFHPENMNEDAAAVTVNHLLSQLYYQSEHESQLPLIADELNRLILNRSKQMKGRMATTLSAIFINPQKAVLMYTGDSPMIRIHGKHFRLITPLKTSSYLENYLGNAYHSGRDMSSFVSFPLCKNDIYILATDGALEAFYKEDGTLDQDEIRRIVLDMPGNNAQNLIRISGERNLAGTEMKCTDDRTAMIIRIEEINYEQE